MGFFSLARSVRSLGGFYDCEKKLVLFRGWDLEVCSLGRFFDLCQVIRGFFRRAFRVCRGVLPFASHAQVAIDHVDVVK